VKVAFWTILLKIDEIKLATLDSTIMLVFVYWFAKVVRSIEETLEFVVFKLL